MLRLHEIGSRHNSYINMILIQVAFSILTAYFLGRHMSDVSMGVTGREWLTVFFFCASCDEDRRSLFAERIEMEEEDMLSDGEMFFGGESVLKRGYAKMRMGLQRGTSQSQGVPRILISLSPFSFRLKI